MSLPPPSREDRGLVLIVEDEADLRALLDFNLRQAGYQTLPADSGSLALELARTRRPRALLLDLNLPDLSGTDVCRVLKSDAHTRGIPVLMLTARAAEDDRVLGLELGADDYITKPFSMRELVLRLEAVLRRVQASAPAPRVLSAGAVDLDLDAHVVRLEGRELSVTALELRLLTYFAEAPGRVRTREDLLAHVWGLSTDVETRTIDTCMKRLRDKLGRHGEMLETVRGVGFRLRPPELAAPE